MSDSNDSAPQAGEGNIEYIKKPLTLSELSKDKLTPMLVQYSEVKLRHPDSILFYRMGDFYEMFFEDAEAAAPVLEVQLTSRDRNSDRPIPMCGVPFHSASGYIQKLLEHGFKVAICEQLEAPGETKGLVRRDVIRILTPALVGDPELVSENQKNLLACISSKDEKTYEVSFFDLLAVSVKTGVVSSDLEIIDLFHLYPPKELLLSSSMMNRQLMKLVNSCLPHLLVTTRDEHFLAGVSEPTVVALERYLEETQKSKVDASLWYREPLRGKEHLRLDSVAVRSLEILEPLSGGKGPSLFSTIDCTATAMGRRLLKDWLVRPLQDRREIENRLGAVRNLVSDPFLSEGIRSLLSQMRDLERLTTKTALGLALPRDLVAIREVLKRIPGIKEHLARASSPLLNRLHQELDPLLELALELELSLLDEPASGFKEGGIFRETYRPELKDLRTLANDAKGMIASMESRERERTGITSLKIKFSRVFGYTIEITQSNLSRVPPDYIRKQTIANGERFVTEELRAFEQRAVTADHQLKGLEENLFLQLRSLVARQAPQLIRNGRILAEVDVLQSFAEQARQAGYVEPQFHDGWDLIIKDGRHPVVEGLLPSGKFVPNGMDFKEEESRTWIITGPNMAGKSTVMRQVGLITLLAHAGSFVPAHSVKMALVDAIYTRIGSSDDLAGGRSTFMVEMSEMARILAGATSRSLLIVDEVGRGTSTYDGLSLAWSLVEFIHTDVQAKTLFATHFHEVTELEKNLPRLKNAHVLVKKWNNEIVFLHRLEQGVCHQSYGLEVARLANLPPKVLLRARDILGVLETQAQKANRARHNALGAHDAQLGFFEPEESSKTRARMDI